MAKLTDGPKDGRSFITQREGITPQEVCDAYNTGLRERGRNDVRWTVYTAGAPMLAADHDWEIEHDKRLKANAERERQDWLHRHRYPASYGPPIRGDE